MLVLIENNVKAAASAEILFGMDPELSDFAIVQLGSGIGAAVVSNGQLFWHGLFIDRRSKGNAWDYLLLPCTEQNQHNACSYYRQLNEGYAACQAS